MQYSEGRAAEGARPSTVIPRLCSSSYGFIGLVRSEAQAVVKIVGQLEGGVHPLETLN